MFSEAGDVQQGIRPVMCVVLVFFFFFINLCGLFPDDLGYVIYQSGSCLSSG